MLGGSLLLSGCGAKPLTRQEVDVIATRPGDGADFAALRTFSLPNRIVDLCYGLAIIPPSELGGSGNEGGLPSAEDVEGCVEPDHSEDAFILERLAAELEGLGYEQAASDSADIVVLAGLVAQAEIQAWDGVPWCFADPLYSGCWAPTYSYQYRLQYGALLLDFVLPDQSESGDLESAWTAVLSGVAIPDADRDEIEEALSTAFEQSPYLADGGSP